VVGSRPALLKDRLGVHGINWLGAAPLPDDGIEVRVKMRSAQDPVPATVRAVANDRAEVVLDQAHAGIAPGQACVFYDGERVLGGGWIAREDAAARPQI
jgi:tRNA-specific 2-thiouridylase